MAGHIEIKFGDWTLDSLSGSWTRMGPKNHLLNLGLEQGKGPVERPKKTRDEVLNDDMGGWDLSVEMAQGRVGETR